MGLYIITKLQSKNNDFSFLFYLYSFIHLNTKETQLTQERFKVHPSLDTLLIFNEDSARPVASVSMADIPTQTLVNVISANQYLVLPRLSSQEMLDGNL